MKNSFSNRQTCFHWGGEGANRLIPHADAWRFGQGFLVRLFRLYPVLLIAMEIFHLTVCPMRGNGLVVSGLLPISRLVDSNPFHLAG